MTLFTSFVTPFAIFWMFDYKFEVFSLLASYIVCYHLSQACYLFILIDDPYTFSTVVLCSLMLFVARQIVRARNENNTSKLNSINACEFHNLDNGLINCAAIRSYVDRFLCTSSPIKSLDICKYLFNDIQSIRRFDKKKIQTKYTRQLRFI